jgi:photosystem II stability/assembly factor-like uncharacterized protein
MKLNPILFSVLLLFLCLSGCDHSGNNPLTPGTSSTQWIEVSGPPSGVLCLASRGNLVFVGTDQSGVFESSDGGMSWSQASDGLPSYATNGSQVSAVYPQIWALTFVGSDIFAGTSGYGVFLSKNMNTKWKSVNVGFTNPNITSLVVNGTTIIAGTYGGGIFSSSNNGSSWVQSSNGLPIYNLGGTTNYAPVRALTLGSVAGGRMNIYAGSTSGVFVSTNDGTSWNPRSSGLSDTSITSVIDDGANLFAGTYGGNVYRSTDTGASWVPITGNLSGTPINQLTVSSQVTGGLNLLAATDKGIFSSTSDGGNWSAVYNGPTSLPPAVGCFDVVGSSLLAGTNAGIIRSTDSGSTWGAMNPNGFVNTFSVISQASGNRYLFAGTQGGVFLSTDDGIRWTPVKSGLTNLSIDALVSSGQDLYAGAFDNTFTVSGGVFHSTNNGTNWTAVNNGLTNTNIVSLSVSGTILMAGSRGGAFLSTNQGSSWSPLNTGLTSTAVSAVAIIGDNLFAGGVGGIFRSTDIGNSWSRVDTGRWGIFIQSFGVKGTEIFVGTQNNGLFRSSDLGATWEASFGSITSSGIAASIGFILAITATNTDVFFGSQAGGVFRSNDDGKTWVQFNEGLMSGYINGLVTVGSYLYAGTYRNGVWRRVLNN